MRDKWFIAPATAVFLFAIHSPAFAQEVIELFDGKTLSGWTTMDGKPVTQGWEAVDGALRRPASAKRAGNILTEQEFEYFDLQFEWKIAEGGNSGLKYRVGKYGNRTLGCEYQILDDSAYLKRLRPKGLTGSLYDIYEPSSAEFVKPIGEFNHSRIVVWGNRIQHWMNGHLIVSAVVGSREWNERIAKSKFADIDGFGENRSGKIMLTDHGSEVWYRNIILKPLPPPTATTTNCRRAFWLEAPRKMPATDLSPVGCGQQASGYRLQASGQRLQAGEPDVGASRWTRNRFGRFQPHRLGAGE